MVKHDTWQIITGTLLRETGVTTKFRTLSVKKGSNEMRKISFFVAAGIALFFLSCNSDEDKSSTGPSSNGTPVIQSVTANPSSFPSGSHTDENATDLNCIATDPEGDILHYNWSCAFGEFLEPLTNQTTRWFAYPNVTAGTYYIRVVVSDGIAIDIDSVAVRVTG